jgi:hypothetical protein
VSQPTNKPEKLPDTARTYERAKPEKESPSGQLDAPKPPPSTEHDHLQNQNPKPRRHPNGSGDNPQREDQ